MESLLSEKGVPTEELKAQCGTRSVWDLRHSGGNVEGRAGVPSLVFLGELVRGGVSIFFRTNQ